MINESRGAKLARLRESLNPLYQPVDESQASNFLRLPGTPRLLPGESFSSWQWRIQTFLQIPTKPLQSALGIDAPAKWVDAGRYGLDLQHIAHAVMQSTESLQPLLWPGESLLADPRLACLTSSPVRRRPIIRYCELCLRSDPTPYIRQLWRLACAYICPQHGTILRELCANCQQAFKMPVYKHRRADRPLRRCHACGYDLCAAAPANLPGELGYFVLARQVELLQLISAESRLAETGDNLQASSEYSFSTGISGLIDLESEQSARMLFKGLLGGYIARTKPPVEQARSTLDTYLLKIPVDVSGAELPLPVAFNGLKVFGEHAATMFMHLVGRHDPWGATHWGSEDLVHATLGSSVFEIGDFAPELQRGWPNWSRRRKFRRNKQRVEGKLHGQEMA